MRFFSPAKSIFKIVRITFIILYFSGLSQGLDSLELMSPFHDAICAFICVFVKAIPALAVTMIVVAGVLWVYSQDDAAKRNQAKTWVLHALIGAIIATVAYFLAIAISPGGIVFPCPNNDGCWPWP
ncbi:MAG: hypothetical protein ABH851_02340 [Methanobacteriota archaeon]